MKNLLKTSLLLISLSSLAACSNNLETLEAASTAGNVDGKSLPAPTGVLPGKLARVVFVRSGWFPAPGMPNGIRMEVNYRADLGLSEFSAYDLNPAQARDVLKCARTFITANHYDESKAAVDELRYGTATSGVIDRGNAYLTLTDHAGNQVSRMTDQSDFANGKDTLLVNSQGVEAKLYQMLELCQRGAGK